MTSLTRYERALIMSSDLPGDLRPTLAHASLAARKSSSTRNEREAALVEVAAGVAAPFLLSYTSWILEIADREGIEDLYFLSRDGQYLHHIARKLSTALAGRCEVHYLEASRVTLNLAAAGGISEETWSFLLGRVRRMTGHELGERLHLTSSELAEVMRRAGLGDVDWTRQLGAYGAESIPRVLLQEDLRQLIRDRAAREKVRTLPYLRQEGFLDDRHIGVVDVGGAGSQFRALSALRREEGLSPPVGFLVCRYTSQSPQEATGFDDRAGCARLHVYLRDDVAGTGVPRFNSLVNILEVFSAADHGRVKGYQYRSGRWHAVSDGDYGSAVSEWGLDLVRRTMDEFVHEVVKENRSLPSCSPPPAPLVDNLRRFILHPTRWEARAWATFPVGEPGSEMLAAPLRINTLVRTIVQRRRPSEVRLWWPGAVKLASWPVQFVVTMISRVRRASGR